MKKKTREENFESLTNVENITKASRNIYSSASASSGDKVRVNEKIEMKNNEGIKVFKR